MVSRIENLLEACIDLVCGGTPKDMEKAAGLVQNLAVIADNRPRVAKFPGAMKGLVNLLWTGSVKAQEDAAATIGVYLCMRECVCVCGL